MNYHNILEQWLKRMFRSTVLMKLYSVSLQRQRSSMRPGSLFFSLRLWSGGNPPGRTWSVVFQDPLPKVVLD